MSIIFKTVFGVILAITLWLSANAVYDLWIYWRLDKLATATVYKWSIQEISPSEFSFKASYRFKAKGGDWKGKVVFGKPYHLNRTAAEKALSEKMKQRQIVWYNFSNPKLNFLERHFPYKKCFHAFISLGILIYFFNLRYYESIRNIEEKI